MAFSANTPALNNVPPTTTDRRAFLTLTGTAVVASLVGMQAQTPARIPMYGLIGKIKTAAGQRDALAAILLAGTGEMPGCLSYIVAIDPKDPDALWVTEVWESPESHQASLTLPAVQAAIAKGRPLIAGFGDRVETTPLGGYGLRKPDAR